MLLTYSRAVTTGADGVSGMYDPVSIPRGLPSRRRVWAFVVCVLAAFAGIVVTVLLTMPREPLPERLTLDELARMAPDSVETEALAETVRARIADAAAALAAQEQSAAAEPVVCNAPNPPTAWNSTQLENATTIVQVGLALEIPERGLIVALATAMQESTLNNYGHLGANNDHDSLGLFQQRPSMGWGSPEQVTDPVYSATAFYLALKRVPGWESMAITVAAQSVQRSGFPYAYAKWEGDATALTRKVLCNLAAAVASPA
jgi:hypothetical protein